MILHLSLLSSHALIQLSSCAEQYALQVPYLESILFARTVHGPICFSQVVFLSTKAVTSQRGTATKMKKRRNFLIFGCNHKFEIIHFNVV